MSLPARFDVRDLGLAEPGLERLRWLESELRLLAGLRERFGRQRPLAGLRVSLCLDVTAPTGILARVLVAGGADVLLCAASPATTDDEVAAALVSHDGLAVLGASGETHERFYAHLDAACDHRPQVIVDHSGDIVGLLHAARREQLGTVLGATEQTPEAAMRVRALADDSVLAFPVIAVSEGQSLRALDDVHGIGQEALETVMRATGRLIAGTRVVVAGYGRRGRGIAERARGMGAVVTVTEVSPARALEAALGGFQVMPMRQAAAIGEIFLTATGARGVLAREHLELMPDGAVLLNAGHLNVEIDLVALRALAARSSVDAGVERFTTADGRTLALVGQGQALRRADGRLRPVALEDAFLAATALAAEHLVLCSPDLDRRVYGLPAAVDGELARRKLDVLGVEIDRHDDQERRHPGSWPRAVT